MNPKRIQRRRTKGWRMPDGAVYVGRPSKWGNPFPLHGEWATWMAVTLGYRGDADGRRAASVALYRSWLTGTQAEPLPLPDECGAIEYDSGDSVPLAQVARGFAAMGAAMADVKPVVPYGRPSLDGLRGRDLVCWCQLDQPCHADVLLELANAWLR